MFTTNTLYVVPKGEIVESPFDPDRAGVTAIDIPEAEVEAIEFPSGRPRLQAIAKALRHRVPKGFKVALFQRTYTRTGDDMLYDIDPRAR